MAKESQSFPDGTSDGGADTRRGRAPTWCWRASTGPQTFEDLIGQDAMVHDAARTRSPPTASRRATC